MIFLTILTAGLPLIISRTSAGSIIDRDNKTSHLMVSSGILFSILLSFIVCLCILIFKPIFYSIFAEKTSYLVLITLIPFLVSSGIYAPIKGYLWGKEDFFSVSIVELFEQIIKIFCCIILFNIIDNNNLPAGISMSIACTLSTILGIIIYIRKKGRFLNPLVHLKDVVKQSTPITAIRVAGSLLQPLISIVLPLRLVFYGFSNTQAMSQLGIVMGMTFPLLTIPSTLIGSLSMAVSPKLTILQKKEENIVLKKQIIDSITISLASCFLFVPIFYSLGLPMCDFLFSNSTAGEYLSKFAWVVIPMGFSQITTSILNSLCEEKFVFYTYFISSFSIIIAILFLPKYVGISALLIGLGLQNAIISVLNMVKIRKIIDSKTNIAHLLLKFTIIALICGLLSKFLYNLLIILLTPFISMFLLGLLITFSFFTLCYAFEIINLQLIFQKKKKAKQSSP